MLNCSVIVMSKSREIKISKFERARLLGARSLQISQNAPVMTKKGELHDSLNIAEKELKDGKMPLEVVRDEDTE